MTDSFGGRLVLAPVTLKPGDRVLDSGSGAGSLFTASDVEDYLTLRDD